MIIRPETKADIPAIDQINFIHVENDEYGGSKLAESIAAARTKITGLVAV